MKTPAILISIVISSLLIISCNKNESCPDNISLGDISYTEKTLASMQSYFDKTSVVFKDSLDQEIAFYIIDRSDTVSSHRFLGSCETNPGQNVFYEYKSTLRVIGLTNDSLGHIFIYINTDLAFDSYEFYDNLRVDNLVSYPTGYQSLNMLVDRRNVSEQQASEINSNVLVEDQTVILGKSFNETYHMKSTSVPDVQIIYYNYEFGIVSFKDATAKTWVFDRFE